MTKPTQIYLGPDGPNHQGEPKVRLRTILFATAKRGRFIEGMHVTLSRNESKQNFPIWVLGNERLSLGSGLFVGENGHSADHHFLTMREVSNFSFTEGRYRLEVFAKILGSDRHLLLFRQELVINEQHGKALTEPKAGIYFDWGPDAGEYIAHVDRKEAKVTMEDIIDLRNSFRESGISI
jgi:hypothetical protein